MGVTGLWQVVQPCARPIKIETLNRKRLAVDASIWIYQFLKAVRDKEGNALRNSHVVGFFRRICKLLFIGIKPVFVFDGGAPVLKRQTINSRKARREGRREDAARTAGKLLAVQMQRKAEEEERRSHAQRQYPAEQEEEVADEDLVYTEELLMSEKEKKQNRTFKKRDAYHLPNLDVSLSEMGAPNDPRIMSQEELEEYARQFHTGEDVNVYDFSKIDFGSPFFQSLPAADRYNILNAARLRSRLRMGYSKEQLDTMFPDRMAFSKFQIERVKERNELTQRLMNLNGMVGDEFINGTQRVAGERGKEYILVKNDGVEGGWALGVVSNNRDEGERNQPIDVEAHARRAQKVESSDNEADFEDIPMGDVSQIPKQPLGRDNRLLNQPTEPELAAAEQVEEDPDSLFLADGEANLIADDDEDDALFEDVLPPVAKDEEDGDEDLQRAIAMSLEKDDATVPDDSNVQNMSRLDFNEKTRTAGRTVAQITNQRAQSSVINQPAENMFSNTTARRLSPKFKAPKPQRESQKCDNAGFSGPLPFESLSLGGSFLRKKKKPGNSETQDGKDKKPEVKPPPPWFSASDVREGAAAQTAMDVRQMHEDEPEEVAERGEPYLRKHDDMGVIDVDATQSSNQAMYDPITIHDSDHGSDVEELRQTKTITRAIGILSPPRMDNAAENIRTNSPKPLPELATEVRDANRVSVADKTLNTPIEIKEATLQKIPSQSAGENEDEDVEWSDSETEVEKVRHLQTSAKNTKDHTLYPQSGSESSDPEFEDVAILTRRASQSSNRRDTPSARDGDDFTPPRVTSEPINIDEDEFSDPEDEDLMAQLAAEAEEHARFAASLSQDNFRQSAEEYERELRSLRNQQKKDRRDADEVSHIMITECQQLLQLFGLPYITAPMEAEAQCAELVQLGLVDGIVTDDSDIFLFGGTRVYKNMFNQAKYVECYLASDLEKEYGLTREKVIQFSHLLGSDYVDGLPGVGPVSALEIISEFGDLSKFHDWWTEVQSGVRPPPSEAKQSGFKKKFRKNASKIFLSPDFPDARVDEAYLKPEVDHDTTPFQWGVPDLDALRSFLMSTIGWNRERADEILVPVVRDMNKRDAEGTQANITRFFSGSTGTGTSRMRGLAGDHGDPSTRNARGDNRDQAARDAAVAAEAIAAAPGGESFAPRRRLAQGGSKRMTTALGRLQARVQAERSQGNGDDTEDAIGNAKDEDGITSRKRRKPRAAGDSPNSLGTDSGEDDGEKELKTNQAPSSKRPRKARKTKAKT